MQRRKLVLPQIVLELRRRAVFRAAAAYILGAWLLIEAASVVLGAFDAPEWTLQALIIALVALFPVMMLVSWRFDLTRHGFVRTIRGLHKPHDAANVDEPGDVALPAGISGSERRILSVLVCRLDQGSHSQPAKTAQRLAAQRRAVARVVAAHGGHIAEGVADESLAYFGYPVAHEDDARRALRAGLGILSITDAAGDADGKATNLAVAVHTDLAVVGSEDLDSGSVRIVGPPVDTARRLHDIAEPGSLLVSDTSWQRAEGYFDGQVHTTDQPIDGVGTIYRVLARTGVHNRLDLSAWQDLTPIAGRDRELALLQDHWHKAMDGIGQVVLLSGEPGIGKSRLIEAIKQTISVSDEPTVMAGYCSAYRTGSALFPFVSLLLQTIPELESDLRDERRLAALHGFLDEHGLYDDQDFCLLANLLGMDAPNASIVERLSPPMRMQRTASALLSILLAHAGERPLLLVVEDLHWADPSSLALLAQLVDHAATSRLLALLSFRPGFAPEWAGRSHVSALSLGRLPLDDARALLNGIPGAATLPDAVLHAVVRKTDGVPLFVEEVVKIVLAKRAEGDREIGPEAVDVIPDTLQESLMARLDQLGRAKGVAQLGSMLGREFSYKVLEAVAGMEQEPLRARLAELLAAEMLFQKGVPPRSLYLFKHALIQDAAYRSLLRKDRLSNHLRIARLLEQRFPDMAVTQPETLARHFAAGGEAASAARYYQSAGANALKKSAAAEAAEHVGHGLEQLDALAHSADRDQLELGLRMVQGPALMATVGFADPRTREVYERAQSLSGSLQDVSTLIPILFGLWIHHGARGELTRSLELARQLLGIAHQAQDDDLLIEGNLVVGCSSFHMGDLQTCCKHFEQILAGYRSDDHAHHAYVFGQDPMAAGAAYLSSALWCLGQPTRALEVGEQAVARAREIDHPYTLALALVFVTRVHQMNRDPKRVAHLAGEVLQVTEEYGFPTWHGFALILKGWADALLGDVQQGLALVEQGLGVCSLIQLGVSRAYFLSMAAEVRLMAHDADGAAAWLDEAENEIRTHGTQVEQPEVHRVRARVEHARGNASATDAIAQGVTVARELQAPAWEILCLCERLALGLSSDEAADRQRVQRLLDDLPDAGDWHVRRSAMTALKG